MTSSRSFVQKDDTKSDIRRRLWDYLVKEDLALFPLPPHGRIPNFKGSSRACDVAAGLEVFQKARSVKIDPDKPLEQIRFRTLEAGKTLYVPTPRLRTGLLNRVQTISSNVESLRHCASMQGIRNSSVPVDLNDAISVDLVVVGCVAVSPKGWRIGKGEGYSDMEFALMTSVYAVNRDVAVVAVVHDCQVVDLPDCLFGPHDLSVDYIATPTRIIECKGRAVRPSGLLWNILTKEKLREIPVLRLIYQREREMGNGVCLADDNDDTVGRKLGSVGQRMQKYPSREERQTTRPSKKEFHMSNEMKSLAEYLDPVNPSSRKLLSKDCVKVGRESPMKESSERGTNTAKITGVASTAFIQNCPPKNFKTENSNVISSDSGHRLIEINASGSQRGGCVFVGNIPSSVSVRELKDAIRNSLSVSFKLKWMGSARYAFLDFEALDVAESAVASLTNLQIRGQTLRVEMAKQHRTKLQTDEKLAVQSMHK